MLADGKGCGDYDPVCRQLLVGGMAVALHDATVVLFTSSFSRCLPLRPGG